MSHRPLSNTSSLKITAAYCACSCVNKYTEAEFKEKHGVWDPMPELTITSPYVHSRVDSNTFTMGNPMLESSLTLCQSRLYPPSQRLWMWSLVLFHRDVNSFLCSICENHSGEDWVPQCSIGKLNSQIDID